MDDRVIHRHGADHDRALVGQLLAEGLGVAMAGQIHNGLCAHVHGAHHLLHLDVVILAVAGDAQIDVDLGAQHAADALRVQAGVVLVGRDGDLALGHQLTDLLRGAVLLLGDDLHFLGHDALAGRVHLCGVILHLVTSSLTSRYALALFSIVTKEPDFAHQTGGFRRLRRQTLRCSCQSSFA